MIVEDVAEGLRVLAAVLAAVERGELEATPMQVGALVGALESLKVLQQTDV